MIDIAVFAMRARPFCHQHLYNIVQALEHAQYAFVIVGSANEPINFRNPFTAAEVKQMVRGSLTPMQNDRVYIFEMEDQDSDRTWVTKVQEAVRAEAERLSIAERASDGSVFALNFYRHEHQRPLADRHLADFSELSAALLALAQKHIALVRPAPVADARRQRLLAHAPDLTGRELDVCLRLLQGLTQDGTAADLGLSAATVKTYRNRAFARLGIQHRNQLFALIAG